MKARGNALNRHFGSAKMRPRARLIGLIGEELISDEPVALVELVKNAYDADAKAVHVRFEGADALRPNRIVVVDDGIGMSLETVLGSWFEPGTVSKRKLDRSPAGRPYQGAKGIGRFAAARLAQTLFLESKKKHEDQGVFVRLDWGRFDDESYLDEIELNYELRALPDISHGTPLTLDGLRKNWERDDFEELHSRLSRLISPFGEVTDFTVFLDVPGYPEFCGEVHPPELLLQPKYLLTGTLDSDGYFTGEVRSEDTVHRKFDKQLLVKGKPHCGPFEVEIRAWDRDREGLDPIVERLGLGIQEIRRILNSYCGVSIYRDGFRVYPYGQKGNDWLNLDLRSRLNPVKNMANNQIVAAIRISREKNSGLKDRSTREGMVLNSEHAALEACFVEVLNLLETARYDLRPRRETAEKSEPLFEAFDLTDTVLKIKGELGATHPVTLLITDTEKQVQAGVDRLQEVFSRLLLSAGLGHMVDIVIHEIGSPLGKLNRQLVVLERRLTETLPPSDKKQILPMLESMKAWLEQIHSLRQRLDPQTPTKRGRATAFDVVEEVQDNFNLYEALIAKQHIKYEIHVPGGSLIVKMNRAALGQIVANLIDNSIFWITRKFGAGNGGQISVRIEELEHGFRVLFSDDGPGVPVEHQTKIFEAYYSTKPNGMGLGLYIARLIIDPYGRLSYYESGDLPGACFEAIFERGVGR